MGEPLPDILRQRRFLQHVGQTVSGCIMNCINFVAQQEGSTNGGDAFKSFFKPENKELAHGLFHHFLRQYTQSLCDDYCTVYGAVFMDRRYSLEKAMGLEPTNERFLYATYAFRIFNQIFEESRRAREEAAGTTPSSSEDENKPVPGPLHLGCISVLICKHFAPLVFDEVWGSFATAACGFAMGGAGKRVPPGTLSEAEKNIIRSVIGSSINDAFTDLGKNRLEEVKALKFVCKDDTCDQGWDWTSMPPSKQESTRAAAAAEWKRLRETGANVLQPPQREEEEDGDEEEEEEESEEEDRGSDDDDPSSDSDEEGNIRNDRVINKRYANYGTGETYVFTEERKGREQAVIDAKKTTKAEAISKALLEQRGKR